MFIRIMTVLLTVLALVSSVYANEVIGSISALNGPANAIQRSLVQYTVK